MLPSLLTLLEAAANVPTAAQMSLAESCLECLGHACALPYHALAPHKRRVLAAVRAPLDHPKRRVRRAASDCANRWHLLKAAA